MFDEIDFLDPTAPKEKARRKPAAPASTDFVIPQKDLPPPVENNGSSGKEGSNILQAIGKLLEAGAGSARVSHDHDSEKEEDKAVDAIQKPIPGQIPVEVTDVVQAASEVKPVPPKKNDGEQKEVRAFAPDTWLASQRSPHPAAKGDQGVTASDSAPRQSGTPGDKLRQAAKEVKKRKGLREMVASLWRRKADPAAPSLPENNKPLGVIAKIPEIRPVDEVVDQAYRKRGLLPYGSEDTTPRAFPSATRVRLPSSVFTAATGNAQVPEVNLLPEHGKRNFSFSLKPSLVVWTAVTAALLIGSATGYYYRQANKSLAETTTLQREIDTLEAELESYESLREGVEAFQRMEALDQVLKRHTHWLNFLAFIEEKTLPETFYNSLRAAEDGNATLKIEAPSYNAAASQVAAYMSDERIQSVTVNAMEGKSDSDGNQVAVIFDLIIKFDPAIVLPNNVTVPAE